MDHEIPLSVALDGETDTVYLTESPTSTEVEPLMVIDVTGMSGSETVMVCVSYSPYPSSAVALRVTEPAAVKLTVQDVLLWLMIVARLEPELMDHEIPLSVALEGETDTVYVFVSPTSAEEEPLMVMDVTGTSGFVTDTVRVAETPEPSSAVAFIVTEPAELNFTVQELSF